MTLAKKQKKNHKNKTIFSFEISPKNEKNRYRACDLQQKECNLSSIV